MKKRQFCYSDRLLRTEHTVRAHSMLPISLLML